jgi:hypothetical protein
LFLFLYGCNRKQYATKTEPAKPVAQVQHTVTDSASFIPKEKKGMKNYIPVDPQILYADAFNELKGMVEGKTLINFKRAVFLVENAYLDNKLDYGGYSKYVDFYANVCREWMKANRLKNYKYPDSINVATNGAIFHVMTDTVYSPDHRPLTLPLTYDFEHYFPSENRFNSFVTKLMTTGKGNCHSLPFFYKIMSLELGTTCYFSMAPEHIFLKMKSKKDGWYNTELTNAMFPTDAWVMASGYVSKESIVSGIYMDTLDLKQSLCICLNDLAKGYESKFQKSAHLDFILSCCELGLKYYPNYAELVLLKAETLKMQYQWYVDSYGLNAPYMEPYKAPIKGIQDEMKQSYALLVKLAFREVPEEMFTEWLNGLEKNKKKYEDKRISDTFIYQNQSK